MHPIDQHLARFADTTVLCIGDLMLDHFVYGEVSRVSPEAPTLVIAAAREEQLLGGAGNVARGIATLGAQCILVGVIGDHPAPLEIVEQRCSRRIRLHGAMSIRTGHPCYPAAR